MAQEVPPQLRWACRRGMLELDVLLGNYLNEAFLNASKQDQDLFVELLSENDQDLFMWLTGKETAKDAKISYMVEKIREHARNRH